MASDGVAWHAQIADQCDSVMVQENARLRDAIAVAQQQLHGLAAAAERRALAEAVLAEEGEQQAHLLVHIMFYVFSSDIPASTIRLIFPSFETPNLGSGS